MPFTPVPAPTGPYKVASVVVSPTTATIALGGTQSFTATAKDGNGNTVNGVNFSWESANPSVATIDVNGNATAYSGRVQEHQKNVAGAQKKLGGLAHIHVFVKKDNGEVTQIKATAALTVTGA